MAWIESHQTLREHPKLHRLARLLDVPRTSAAGLLHFLWWWALDHAEDGNITHFDALDIALAAGWEGDPEVFLGALIDCGPGDRAGFVERVDGGLYLHDWYEFAGKLIDRRVRDRERKRTGRGKSDASPTDVQGTGRGNPGVQNPTEPNPKDSPSSADADGVSDTFDEWWTAYPKKVGKKAARRAYLRALKDTGADVLLTAMTARAELWRRDGTARQFIPDPATWLNQGRWDDELDQPAPVTELRPDAMLVRNQRRQSGEACPECADAGLILDGDGLAWPCLTCQREDAG